MNEKDENWLEELAISKLKYRTIQKHCQLIFRDYDKPILAYENISKLNSYHNLFHLQGNNNYYWLEILFYFDWFPHLADIIITQNDYTICQVLYYLIFENQKPNARNWDLFDNNEKVEMNFNEFLIYLISKYKNFQSHFLTKEDIIYFKCNNCSKKKIFVISSKLNICKNFLFHITIKKNIV
jgi:hypothetical protein